MPAPLPHTDIDITIGFIRIRKFYSIGEMADLFRYDCLECHRTVLCQCSEQDLQNVDRFHERYLVPMQLALSNDGCTHIHDSTIRAITRHLDSLREQTMPAFPISPIRYEIRDEPFNYSRSLRVMCEFCRDSVNNNIAMQDLVYAPNTANILLEAYLRPMQRILQSRHCHHFTDEVIARIVEEFVPQRPRPFEFTQHDLAITWEQYGERYLQPAMQTMVRDAMVDGIAMARNVLEPGGLLVKKSIAVQLMEKQKDKFKENGYALWVTGVEKRKLSQVAAKLKEESTNNKYVLTSSGS